MNLQSNRKTQVLITIRVQPRHDLENKSQPANHTTEELEKAAAAKTHFLPRSGSFATAKALIGRNTTDLPINRPQTNSPREQITCRCPRHILARKVPV